MMVYVAVGMVQELELHTWVGLHDIIMTYDSYDDISNDSANLGVLHLTDLTQPAIC